jgi:hypothetical protein
MKLARRHLVVAAVVVAAVTGGLAPGGVEHAAAGEAEGCSGTAQSIGPDGGLLDQLAAPGEGGTPDDPFDIFADGRVTYSGTTDQVIRNGTWAVDVSGVLGVISSVAEFISGKSPLSGKIGSGGEITRQGDFEAKDYIGKLKLSGLHRVTVSLSGEGGASCTATVWIRLHQTFFKSLLAVGGLTFILIALLLFWIGAPSYAVENLTFQMFEDKLSPPAEDKGI